MFLLYRKHTGGTKSSFAPPETTVLEELHSSAVSDELTTESCKELESAKEQKEKSDVLWADFLKDVGCVSKKSQSDSAVSIVVVTIIIIVSKFGLSAYDAFLTLSLPEATIDDHIPWLPLTTISAVFTQYIWAGLSFSWHWQPEIRHTAPIVANGSRGMWLSIVAYGNERVNVWFCLRVTQVLCTSCMRCSIISLLPV